MTPTPVGGRAGTAARGRARQDPAGPVFAALADPTRRWIIRELATDGPLTPTRLATRVGITRQAASKHLAALELAGLGRSERVGRETVFELDTAPFAEAEAWMRAIGASWDQRLRGLRDYLESSAGPAS